MIRDTGPSECAKSPSTEAPARKRKRNCPWASSTSELRPPRLRGGVAVEERLAEGADRGNVGGVSEEWIEPVVPLVRRFVREDRGDELLWESGVEKDADSRS